MEEIRRTVYVGNLEKDCDGDELMEFFNATIGEVSSNTQSNVESSVSELYYAFASIVYK